MGKDKPTNGAKSKPERMIDENLQKVYRETLEQDVPDRFRSLLDKLREKDDEKNKSAAPKLTWPQELSEQEMR